MQEVSGSNPLFSTKFDPTLSVGFFISMNCFVYIIFSEKLDRFYIGYTSDLQKRMLEHNTGISTFTSKAADWKLSYSETFNSRDEAHTRELEIKKKKSRKYIEWLINKNT